MACAVSFEFDVPSAIRHSASKRLPSAEQSSKDFVVSAPSILFNSLNVMFVSYSNSRPVLSACCKSHRHSLRNIRSRCQTINSQLSPCEPTRKSETRRLEFPFVGRVLQMVSDFPHRKSSTLYCIARRSQKTWHSPFYSMFAPRRVTVT